MRNHLYDADLVRARFRGGTKFGFLAQTLGAGLTLTTSMPNLLFLDPGGSGRTLLLPTEASSKGMRFEIVNTADAAEDLTVKEDSNTTTIGIVGIGESGVFWCDGTTWRMVKGSRGIVGLASGYKLARGVHTTVAAVDTVVTGLAEVVSVVVSRATAPVAGAEFFSGSIGNQAGAPAAGSILISGWKPDYTVATTFSKLVNWIAIGT